MVTTPRRVVLVCGPPGAGKTTYAHTLGLTVYDIDDPQWGGSETRFSQAIRALNDMPHAQAVVIRAGATPTARAKAANHIGATHTIILDVDPNTCIQRIRTRARPRPPLAQQITAVHHWWHQHTTATDPQPRTRTRW
jgi:shikimate kinase